MAFKRSWKEVVGTGLVTMKKNEHPVEELGELSDWVFMERE